MGDDILSDMGLELDSSSENITRLQLQVEDSLLARDQDSSDAEEDDVDGPRRRKRSRPQPSHQTRWLTLSHDAETPLSLVGRQLWRGSLLLADYVIARRRELVGLNVLELGCGVGLLGVVLGLALGPSGAAVITDRDEDVLCLARRNLAVNAHLEPLPLTSDHVSPTAVDGSARAWAAVSVRALDWAHDWAADAPHATDMPWDVVLVADCVYDEGLTDLLFANLRAILVANQRRRGAGASDARAGTVGCGGAVAWLSLEKRYNFELATLSVQAHGYRRFLAHIGRGPLDHLDAPDGKLDVRLVGRLLDVDFPRCFEYRRVPQLELWEISLAPPRAD